MFFYTLPFVVGVIVVQQFSELPSLSWLATMLIVVAICSYYQYWRLIIFVLGMLWTISFASMRLNDRLLEPLQGHVIDIEGVVVGLPQYDERKVRFDFSVSKPINNFPQKIRLSWYFPKQTIKAGQFWKFTVKLKKPHGRFNPNGFDYEKWLFIQNISATGYVKNVPLPQKLISKTKKYNFSVLRQLISDNLDELLEDSPNKGLIKALTIGDRHHLSQQQWDVFRKTGTVHLLAISGLHIGLVSGLMYFFILRLSVMFSVVSPQNYAASAAIFIAFFYSVLAGFSLPTQRSLLMLVIALLMTIVWQRKVTAVNTVSMTLLVVLFFDPFAVLSIGFWLSFLAVIIIIYSLAGRLANIKGWKSAIKIHWVTAIGLAPLLLYSFQQVSIISPFANFITVPIISFLVVPLCLLSVVFMFISPVITEQLLFLVDKVLQGVESILSLMSELPYAAVTTGSPPIAAIPVALLGVLILLSPKGLPARWLGLFFLLPLLFIYTERPKQGEVFMTLLDVGQGLSAVIETAHHVLIFETGAKYSNQFDMGNAVVIPFLNSKGINVVDTLLISHADNDHIGGANSILDQVKVDKILTSVPNLLEQFSPERCLRGLSWEWDQVKFEIISPNQNFFESENNNSCVLKVNSNHGQILLTGDIEKLAEDWLVMNAAQQLNSDILIAPHHGSKTSSTLAFLQNVSPKEILIPTGYRNRFSFPHLEVIDRYENIKSNWKSTSNEGAITVKMKNNTILVHSHREDHGKYWNK